MLWTPGLSIGAGLSVRPPGSGPFGGHPTLSDDLLLVWKLNEESDGSGPVPRADALGTYDLTDINTCASTAGKDGNAVKIITANSEVLTSSFEPSGFISCSLWFYITGTKTNANTPLTNVWGTSGVKVQYRPDTNALLVAMYDSVGINSQPGETVADLEGSWHHLVWWLDTSDNKGRYQLDGQAAKVGANALDAGGIFTTVGHGLGVGGATSNLYDGFADEVIFWDRNLTPGERSDLAGGLYY